MLAPVGRRIGLSRQHANRRVGFGIQLAVVGVGRLGPAVVVDRGRVDHVDDVLASGSRSAEGTGLVILPVAHVPGDVPAGRQRPGDLLSVGRIPRPPALRAGEGRRQGPHIGRPRVRRVHRGDVSAAGPGISRGDALGAPDCRGDGDRNAQCCPHPPTTSHRAEPASSQRSRGGRKPESGPSSVRHCRD